MKEMLRTTIAMVRTIPIVIAYQEPWSRVGSEILLFFGMWLLLSIACFAEADLCPFVAGLGWLEPVWLDHSLYSKINLKLVKCLVSRKNSFMHTLASGQLCSLSLDFFMDRALHENRLPMKNQHEVE